MDQTASSEAPRRPFSRRQLLATALATPVALAAGQRWAMAQSPAITVYRGPTDRALVALTFDAGADRGYCASILDTLAGSGVRASFGVTGQWAESNGDLVQRVVAEGHQLFNHTYTHRSFTGLTPGGPGLSSAERLTELETTEQVFINLTGVDGRPYFRPPFGDFNSSVLTDLGRGGFTHNLMWSLDVNGWRGISQDQIVSRVLTNHGNGFIYLLHVGGQSQEGPALPRIISGLRSRGYGFATVSELLGGTAPPPPSATDQLVAALVRILRQILG
ncbi:MAG: polysaccharide deacetylase family protein [Chloroflexota bacterium]|nr:polysaccharide deacetylase family protein [Chloroflexota bacterium]